MFHCADVLLARHVQHVLAMEGQDPKPSASDPAVAVSAARETTAKKLRSRWLRTGSESHRLEQSESRRSQWPWRHTTK